jgi:xanthine dehydrogenase small subunit
LPAASLDAAARPPLSFQQTEPYTFRADLARIMRHPGSRRGSIVRDQIRFLLGDAPVTLATCDPTATLLDWLRLERGLTGTKEGCAEGDCGACTVAVGRLVDGAPRYEAINACIRFLPTLDGCHVLTVDHLKRDGALHPVQSALVAHHGSQCGFCTPGFVMSLFCLGAQESQPDAGRIEDAIAGNLCRCTGYGPIVEAGLACAAGPAPPRDGNLAEALSALADDELVSVTHAGRRFFAPATVAQLHDLLAAHPDATLLAGGTDIGLWVTKEMRVLDPVIWLGRVQALQEIEDGEHAVVLGAGVTHSAAHATLAGLHPHLGELLRRFGGEQVRNAGTIGGNIANGSPIGDLPPALIALDATLALAGPGGRRTMPLEHFFLGYRQTDRGIGEFVESVSIPRLRPDQVFHVSKVTKRFDEDISAVCGAFRLTRDRAGLVTEARLAFGGMAATPKRAEAAEAALVGRPFDRAAAEAAAAALAAEFAPLSDWRASARYRLTLAGNLLRRFQIETAEPAIATRVAGGLRNLAHA